MSLLKRGWSILCYENLLKYLFSVYIAFLNEEKVFPTEWRGSRYVKTYLIINEKILKWESSPALILNHPQTKTKTKQNKNGNKRTYKRQK